MPLALSAMAKGMLGALPQGGKCKPQFLRGSEQTLALTPPHHGAEDVQIPFGPTSGTPETPLRVEAPVALGAPEAIVATPPPQDYGGTGAAPKADQPLTNFPSRPAYPAP